MEYIRQLTAWARKKAKRIRKGTSHAAMRYILWYALLLVLCCSIYVGAWLYHWYTHHDTPDLVELRAFLHEIASAAWIAVIGFLAKSFIDNNHDGIPDQYQQEDNDSKERKDTHHDPLP